MEEKYRRPDIEGGYIYDKNDIEYYKATQRNDVIDNGLLGDYNMVGAYVVNNAIVEELLMMKKVYTDSFGKSIFCESLKLFDGQPISFRLNINSGVPTSTKVTASLELMEDIKRVNGFYRNTNIVLLASKVYDDKNGVNEAIFKDFNVSKADDDESGAKVETNFEVKNIILRYDSLREIRETAVPATARLEKKLFEKRMKVLLSSPKCASLIEEFNRQVFHSQGKFLNKLDKNYYRHVNQVLDSVLQMKGYELTDKNIWKKLQEIGLEYSKEINGSLDVVYSQHEQLDKMRDTKVLKQAENRARADEQKNETEKEKPAEQAKENENKNTTFVTSNGSSTNDSTKNDKKVRVKSGENQKETKKTPGSTKKENIDPLINSAQEEAQGGEHIDDLNNAAEEEVAEEVHEF